ncbi:MAG: UDP-glucose 4-epimerase GalE [Clostridia bacterium]
MKILVTGGAGYIGSHTMVELLNSGYDVVCVDDFSNSNINSIKNVELITGKKIKFYKQNLCDKNKTLKIFKKERPSAVIHFAGLKAVGESVQKPLLYYNNNINSTLSVLDAMIATGCNNLVFSSSATVYGNPLIVPITEDAPIGGTTNPYGTTKYFIERILQDVSACHKNMNIAILRYFNPIGAHKSGLIGENPSGIPNNLMPYITRVSVGLLPQLSVFGNDYDTHDGTGVRDYIHVVDLAQGHISALKALEKNKGIIVCNLGTGKGYSVLDVVKAYEKASNTKIPYIIKARRDGDIATCYSSPQHAKELLGWEAKLTLNDMCEDSFRFQSHLITKK